jgi:hypothetical protein
VAAHQPDADRLALIAEATKRAGLIWITVPGGRARPAWHVWRDAAYVLTGPGEQDVPGLAAARQVTVDVPSKDTGASLVRWTARVSRVQPGSAEWSAILGVLLAGRLNEPASPGGPSPAERWAQDGNVYRLTPSAQTGMERTAFDATCDAP